MDILKEDKTLTNVILDWVIENSLILAIGVAIVDVLFVIIAAWGIITELP